LKHAGLLRALNRAVEWLQQNEPRQRAELLRDLTPEQRPGGLLPELTGPQPYSRDRFQRTAEWMLARGFLPEAARYEEIVSNPFLIRL
jgi:ABC-type nitrate/sulfonate/bicarbonate transport system substrate-binding protein